MSKPAVAFADALVTVANRLRAEIPTVPVRVTLTGPAPEKLLLVRPDGPSQNNYPVTANAGVRVIAWAPDEYQARELAMQALTALATFPGDANARSIGGITGPALATDPVTGRDLAYIIATVRQRPVAV